MGEDLNLGPEDVSSPKDVIGQTYQKEVEGLKQPDNTMRPSFDFYRRAIEGAKAGNVYEAVGNPKHGIGLSDREWNFLNEAERGKYSDEEIAKKATDINANLTLAALEGTDLAIEEKAGLLADAYQRQAEQIESRIGKGYRVDNAQFYVKQYLIKAANLRGEKIDYGVLNSRIEKLK